MTDKKVKDEIEEEVEEVCTCVAEQFPVSTRTYNQYRSLNDHPSLSELKVK